MAEQRFSFIIIPDTQELARSCPEYLMQLADWIVSHADELNLKMVLHLGDVVDHGANVIEEWERAKRASDKIDAANIPMMLAIGNHDYDNLFRHNRDSNTFNSYFGIRRFEDKPWFGGVFEEGKAENMFTLLNIDGRPFIFLSLEFGPRGKVIEWANDVLARHEDHEAIVITHSYMYMHGERTKPGDEHNPKVYGAAKSLGDVNDGEDLWEKCLKHHKNLRAVFSGHHIYENISWRFDYGVQKNIVFQSFQNWQCTEKGGKGRFRLMQYVPDENNIQLNVINSSTGSIETGEGYEVKMPIKGDIGCSDLTSYPGMNVSM